MCKNGDIGRWMVRCWLQVDGVYGEHTLMIMSVVREGFFRSTCVKSQVFAKNVVDMFLCTGRCDCWFDSSVWYEGYGNLPADTMCVHQGGCEILQRSYYYITKTLRTFWSIAALVGVRRSVKNHTADVLRLSGFRRRSRNYVNLTRQCYGFYS